MPLPRSHIRDTVAAYLERHAAESDALSGLLTALDGVAEPADRAGTVFDGGRLTAARIRGPAPPSARPPAVRGTGRRTW
ncbi:hypothetical protein [Streptomyces sp. NPDC055992]|uniref:hypothetical protein n=1 Tax=Streptomyces sp. NPDC055992 TaxID=3345673 RepID=UPI0035E1E379